MNSSPETTPLGPSRRRNGKVARLPKAQRDLINQMLDDGATYPTIIEKLNEQGASLNHANLSHWYEGGHQDWLKEQNWREEIHSRHEAYSDLLSAGQSATRLPEAALQLATTEICRRLHEITLTAHALDGTSDPNSFTRLVHALCRLSREVLHLQKYHDALKAAQEGPGKRFDAFRELTEAERQAILDKADDILGCRAYRNLPPLPLKPPPSVENQPNTTPLPQGSAGVSPAVSPTSSRPPLPEPVSPIPVSQADPPIPSVPSVPSSSSVENQPNPSPVPTSSAGVSPAVSPTSSRPPVPQSVPATPAGQADPPIPSVPSVPSVSSTPPVEPPPDTPSPPAAKPPRRQPMPSMYGPPVQPPAPPKVPSIFDPPVRPTPGAPSPKPHPAFYPGLTSGRKRPG